MSGGADKNFTSLLLRQVQLAEGDVCDVRIADGSIVDMGKSIAVAGIAAQADYPERVIEAGGHLLLPGLHDHHMHLFATAAASASIVCGPPAVNSEETLSHQIQRYAQQGEGWLRGIGFHESVVPGLDRFWLDRVCPDRPVRIQHRSGMLWILNSCAIDQLQLKEDELLPEGVERDNANRINGRFYNLDNWLRDRLPSAWPCLEKLSLELAGYGITGVTDTGLANGVDVWRQLTRAKEGGEFVQRLQVMGNEELHSLAGEAPFKKGSDIGVGPLKIYLRETDLPPLEGLVRRIIIAHDRGRNVAFHCVTLVELYFALAALEEAGVVAGDRIEHASIADNDAIRRLAELGVFVVTQPHFIAERGDQYLQDVAREDISLLYRGKQFLEGGVSLAAGSDAPYGSFDPWSSMNAAVSRHTRSGVVMDERECLSPTEALELFGGDLAQPGGGLRKLEIGQVADLCLMDVPIEELVKDFSASHVALTLCAGKVAYENLV